MPDALLTDLLPAGLEIENFNLGDAKQWADVVVDGIEIADRDGAADVRHEEFRDDRYVAALKLDRGDTAQACSTWCARSRRAPTRCRRRRSRTCTGRTCAAWASRRRRRSRWCSRSKTAHRWTTVREALARRDERRRESRWRRAMRRFTPLACPGCAGARVALLSTLAACSTWRSRRRCRRRATPAPWSSRATARRCAPSPTATACGAIRPRRRRSRRCTCRRC